MDKRISEVQMHLDCQRRLTRPWWFVSFTFPLICAAFAPVANLFSILSFIEPWVVVIFTTVGPKDPPWLLPLNSVALAAAIIANVLLLLSFARRIRNTVAQPLTISLWYTSGTLDIIALSLTKYNGRNTVLSQAYYYALLASIMHIGMATLLLLSFLPSLPLPVLKGTFPAYSSRALILTAPQRTLMLQSLFFTLYLALGAGIFASLNQWSYLDAIYWTDYSLLTIGFGSDFTLVTPVAKGILIPYVAIGIFMLALVIGSIRTLFMENFKERILWGREIVQKERGKWWRSRTKKKKGLWAALKLCRRKRESDHLQDEKYQTPMKWSKEEWELMKALKNRADTRRRYLSLLSTSTLFFSIWFGGAIIFAFTERAQDGFTYALSLYFTYVSMLTIGYGDVVPRSDAGKPIFVLWSLSSIPAVTLLISDIQDTFARWIKEGPVERVFGRWLVGSVGDDNSIHEHEDEMGEGSPDGYDDLQFEKWNEEETKSVQDGKEGLQKARAILRAVRSILEDEEGKQYSWEEWQKWLWLLELDKDKGCEEGPVSNWTWIGDDGPLLSARASEKAWLLTRLRQKLDQQLQDVLKFF